jgi:hypothetical protein
VAGYHLVEMKFFLLTVNTAAVVKYWAWLGDAEISAVIQHREVLLNALMNTVLFSG